MSLFQRIRWYLATEEAILIDKTSNENPFLHFCKALFPALQHLTVAVQNSSSNRRIPLTMKHEGLA